MYILKISETNDASNFYQNVVSTSQKYGLNIIKNTFEKQENYDVDEHYRADDISHFLLRVAYASTEDN